MLEPLRRTDRWRAAMAKTHDKVIITCAVTGAMHTPTMSPYLPLTPDQITEQSIEAAEAGAAILHLHARNPADGQPTPDPAIFDQFVPRIAASTDAVINITTGGSTRMTMEERLAYPLQAKPEMCSLNMGSMNFSIHRAARKIKDWRYDCHPLDVGLLPRKRRDGQIQCDTGCPRARRGHCRPSPRPSSAATSGAGRRPAPRTDNSR